MFLGDFHIHSTFSDGKCSIPEIVDRYGKAGFGAIAITDHVCEEHTPLGRVSANLGVTLTRAKFPFYREILKSEAERAWDKYDMLVLAGFEWSKNSLFNNRSAHMVVLGVDTFIPADGDIATLIDTAHSLGGLVIGAHPVWSRRIFEKQTYQLWRCRTGEASKIDAWETCCGSALLSEVMQEGVAVVASSDFHGSRDMSSWKTSFDCEKSKAAIFEAIRTKKVTLGYYECPERSWMGVRQPVWSLVDHLWRNVVGDVAG